MAWLCLFVCLGRGLRFLWVNLDSWWLNGQGCAAFVAGCGSNLPLVLPGCVLSPLSRAKRKGVACSRPAVFGASDRTRTDGLQGLNHETKLALSSSADLAKF